jgi:hypothetical protein
MDISHNPNEYIEKILLADVFQFSIIRHSYNGFRILEFLRTFIMFLFMHFSYGEIYANIYVVADHSCLLFMLQSLNRS